MADITPAPLTKRCSRCKKTQKIDQFGVDRKRKDGLNPWCKRCKSKARRREYLRVKREQRFGIQLKLELDIRVCPHCKTPKLTSEFGKDTSRKSGLAPYCRPCTSAIFAEMWTRNSVAWTARNLRWRAANPDRAREIALRRIARKQEATVVLFTKEQLAEKWAYWGGKCWICNAAATATDHVKPLAKGGAHMLCNLRPICLTCNSRKGSRWPIDLDWLRRIAAA